MRATEFITEQTTTYAIPGLQSQDPYLQYRFGVAMAAAGAQEQNKEKCDASSEYGEKMIVISQSPAEDAIINKALALVGQHNKTVIKDKLHTTPANNLSPVNSQRKSK